MENSIQQVFEAVMLICFGASWPFAILRTYKAKTAKGKSFVFLGLLILGYTCGMISKVMAPKFEWVFFFYLMNAFMVGTDLYLCIRYWMRENRVELGTATGE